MHNHCLYVCWTEHTCSFIQFKGQVPPLIKLFPLLESPQKERNNGEIPQGTKCDRISQPWQPWRKMTIDDDSIYYIILDSAQSVSDVSAHVKHVRLNLLFKPGQPWVFNGVWLCKMNKPSTVRKYRMQSLTRLGTSTTMLFIRSQASTI